MTPDNKRGRPLPPGRPATTDNEIDATEVQRNATARGFAAPPCPGRSLWLVVVLRCPFCLTMHQHRVGDAQLLLAGEVLRTCPTRGRLYRVTPVQRRREAVRR